MKKAVSLRNFKGQALYIATGDYGPLVPFLSFKSGLQGWLERMALGVQRFFPKRLADRVSVLEQIEREMVQAGLSTIRAAFLYKTGHYKPTQWIGTVETEKGRYFVKTYAKPEDVLFESHHHTFIESHFRGPFVTVPVLAAQNGILVMPAVARRRSLARGDHVEEKFLQINAQFLKEANLKKNIHEMIPMDLLAAVHGSEYRDRIGHAVSWVRARRERDISLVPVHGDATPWNMFVTPDEKIVLVDYERAGWRTPWYDVFHFILQPAALRSRHRSLKSLIFKRNWFEHEAMTDALILYLLDQLAFDLHDRLVQGYDGKHLRRLIRSKLEWLDEIIKYD